MRSNFEVLGKHIRLIDTRNSRNVTDKVLGINIDKFFMPSVANIIGTDLSKYKLIHKGQFACNPMHVGRDERLPVALYTESEPAIVSPAYFMFEITDNSILNEEYLMMWFRRPEFDRTCWLHTDGSVRGGISWDDICRLELPVPNIEQQLDIIRHYKAITNRITLKKRLNDYLTDVANTLFKKTFLLSPDLKNWEKGSFSHFITSTFGGDWGKEVASDNYTQEVSCIRGTDIPLLNIGSISSAPTRFILPKNFSLKKIKANDLVVEISGGSPIQSTGRIALVPQQVLDYRGDNLICSNFCRIVTVNNAYQFYFLQYWLYLYNAGRMFDYENSSTGLKNFNFSDFVEKEVIPIPDEKIALKFNHMVAPLYDRLFLNGFEMEAMQETQQILLPKLLSQ